VLRSARGLDFTLDEPVLSGLRRHLRYPGELKEVSEAEFTFWKLNAARSASNSEIFVGEESADDGTSGENSTGKNSKKSSKIDGPIGEASARTIEKSNLSDEDSIMSGRVEDFSDDVLGKSVFLKDITPLGPSSSVRIIPPYDFTHQFRVKPSEAGYPLLKLMVKRFPFRSEKEWLAKIECGNLLVDGKPTDFAQILHANDTISHRNTGVIEPSVPGDLRILFKNEDLIVIDKPAPMPVHAGGRYNKNTAISVLYDLGYEDLHVVHRLDSVTSGLLIFARNPTAANDLQLAFTSGRVEKRYEAIVRGCPPEDEITINKPIKRKNGYVFMCSDDDDARDAQTVFRVLERGENWSRIACEPITGRTHQIRLHLREWGYPIWDDFLYNGEDIGDAHRVLQNRAISLVNVHLRIV